jgi:hypothetical protein
MGKHQEMITAILHVEIGEKIDHYVTGSRDGAVKIWRRSDLQLVYKINNYKHTHPSISIASPYFNPDKASALNNSTSSSQFAFSASSSSDSPNGNVGGNMDSANILPTVASSSSSGSTANKTWITALAYMPLSKRVAVASIDRVSVYFSSGLSL